MTTNNQQDPGSLRGMSNAELGEQLERPSGDRYHRDPTLYSLAVNKEAGRRLQSTPSEMAARCGEMAKELESALVGHGCNEDESALFDKVIATLTELSQVPSAGEVEPPETAMARPSRRGSK